MGDKSGGDYFVVYWYPTIFHREKQRREDAIMDFEDISDKSDLPLMVKKEEIGKDMKYTLLFKNSGTEIIFWLIYDGNRRNGFTIYKYDRAKLREDLKRAIKGSVVKAIQDGKISFSSEEDLNVALDKYSDTTLDKYIDKIFISCYHSAKDLYHRHEIQNDSDGRLKAYLKDAATEEYLTVKPDINKPNHDAIRFFIEQYESLFLNYANHISDNYAWINSAWSSYIKNNRETSGSKDEAIAILNELDLLVSTIERVPKPLEKDAFSSLSFGESVLSDEDFRESIEDYVKKEALEEKKRQQQPPQEDYSRRELEELRVEIRKRRNQIQYYLIDGLSFIKGMCGNALTEYNYCKSLLESKFNNEYKYDLQLTDDEIKLLGEEEDKIPEELKVKDLRRKCAFNIRNSIRYIVEVRSKCDIWESENTRSLIQEIYRMQLIAERARIQSEKIEEESIRLGEQGRELGRRSVYLGWWSVGLGVISIVLAFLGFILPDFKSCQSNCNRSDTPPAAVRAVTDSSAGDIRACADSCYSEGSEAVRQSISN